MMGSKNSSKVPTIWEEHEMLEPTTRGSMPLDATNKQKIRTTSCNVYLQPHNRCGTKPWRYLIYG